jgi:hypothetical protein
MNVVGELLFPGLALFLASLVLTGLSLWVAGRLAPWFLQEAWDPPSLRSYFLDPMAETDIARGRVVTLLIACAIMLVILLAITVAVRFGRIALI